MSIFHKAGLALIVLGALGQTTAAHALGITLTPAPVTGGGSSPYVYSYSVTPTTFDASQFSFTFSDPNVAFESVTGPLSSVSMTSPGNFVNFGPAGAVLARNSSETIIFTSPDAPTGGTFVAAGTGAGSAGFSLSAPGPAPVPEASTMVSLSLLLALGLGGVAARKKRTA